MRAMTDYYGDTTDITDYREVGNEHSHRSDIGAKEAYILSMQNGGVDLDYMEEISGISKDQLIEDMPSFRMNQKHSESPFYGFIRETMRTPHGELRYISEGMDEVYFGLCEKKQDLNSYYKLNT